MKKVLYTDLNKDGNLDVGAVNSGSNDISVRLATGPATFGGSMNYNSGADPRAITSGDVNGDGAPDLVAVSYGSNNVSVYLNKNDGSGTFNAQTTASVGTSPQHLTLGDFNKDGKLDVVTANTNSNNLTVRLGMGNGTFGNSTAVGAGSSPVYVATADWNKDGKLDVAAVNNGINAGTYMVSILLGDGAGGLGQAVNIDIGSNTVPRGAVVGDFNKDGNPDLAVAGYGNNTLPVLLGKGDGTFEPVVSLNGPANPQSLESADLQGDGWPDLVATTSITGSQNVSILLGQCK